MIKVRGCPVINRDNPAYSKIMEEQARAYLDQIPFWTRKKNTLEQVREFLAELGNPQEQLRIIHVAGTNGKGSVCADLTAILTEAGYRVGTFVSPHLEDVTERFLLNGSPVSEGVFEAGFQKVRAVTKQMTARGYSHPTFFEFVFLMAMVIYEKEKPDYVIMETGLGGRLDTTNAILHPIACVITSISLDHTMYLGDTIPQIASEKAGIIKPGIPVIYDDNEPEASEVIAARADELCAPGYPVGEKDAYRAVVFAAPYQAMNAALAVKVLEVLQVPGADGKICRAGLSRVHWQGRMEQVGANLWLDGAHNPGGIRAFIRAVKAQYAEGEPAESGSHNLQLVFAAVSDKDYHEMIQMLCRELPISRVTIAQVDSARAADRNVLREQFLQAGCQEVETYATAVEAMEAALKNKKTDDRLYVVGSLYLIGEIKRYLRDQEVS